LLKIDFNLCAFERYRELSEVKNVKTLFVALAKDKNNGMYTINLVGQTIKVNYKNKIIYSIVFYSNN